MELLPVTGSAIIDAERALKLNPKFSKGYYRRGTGYFCLGNLKAAQRGKYHFKLRIVCSPWCMTVSSCSKNLRKMDTQNVLPCNWAYNGVGGLALYVYAESCAQFLLYVGLDLCL